MVLVEVKVVAWLIHLFMVHVDYRLRYRLMHGSGLLVQVVWCRLIGIRLQ